MTKSPRITGRKILAALSRCGFKVIRIRGSHHYLRHDDGRATVLPIHAGEVVGPGLFNSILEDCEMTEKEFERWL